MNDDMADVDLNSQSDLLFIVKWVGIGLLALLLIWWIVDSCIFRVSYKFDARLKSLEQSGAIPDVIRLNTALLRMQSYAEFIPNSIFEHFKPTDAEIRAEFSRLWTEIKKTTKSAPVPVFMQCVFKSDPLRLPNPNQEPHLPSHVWTNEMAELLMGARCIKNIFGTPVISGRVAVFDAASKKLMVRIQNSLPSHIEARYPGNIETIALLIPKTESHDYVHERSNVIQEINHLRGFEVYLVEIYSGEVVGIATIKTSLKQKITSEWDYQHDVEDLVVGWISDLRTK